MVIGLTKQERMGWSGVGDAVMNFDMYVKGPAHNPGPLYARMYFQDGRYGAVAHWNSVFPGNVTTVKNGSQRWTVANAERGLPIVDALDWHLKGPQVRPVRSLGNLKLARTKTDWKTNQPYPEEWIAEDQQLLEQFRQVRYAPVTEPYPVGMFTPRRLGNHLDYDGGIDILRDPNGFQLYVGLRTIHPALARAIEDRYEVRMPQVTMPTGKQRVYYELTVSDNAAGRILGSVQEHMVLRQPLASLGLQFENLRKRQRGELGKWSLGRPYTSEELRVRLAPQEWYFNRMRVMKLALGERVEGME